MRPSSSPTSARRCSPPLPAPSTHPPTHLTDHSSSLTPHPPSPRPSPPTPLTPHTLHLTPHLTQPPPPTPDQVLHPSAMAPLIEGGIPLYVKDVFNPTLAGTVIQVTLTSHL